MFKPGQSGNPAGKPVGTTSKVGQKVREMMASFYERKFPELEPLWEDLTSREKFEVMIKFSEYILPKLQRQIVSVTDSSDSDIITIRFGKVDPTGTAHVADGDNRGEEAV